MDDGECWPVVVVVVAYHACGNDPPPRRRAFFYRTFRTYKRGCALSEKCTYCTVRKWPVERTVRT